jgi:hypothetical protein
MTLLKEMKMVADTFFFIFHAKIETFHDSGRWTLLVFGQKKVSLAKFHFEFCIISLWVSHIYREKERGWEYSQTILIISDWVIEKQKKRPKKRP